MQLKPSESIHLDNRQTHPQVPPQPASLEDTDAFSDILDVINPLQHIPVVSRIYRDISGDEISNRAKATGDVLYGVLSGGILGLFSAIGNAVVKQQTDKDVGDHILALLDHNEVERDDNALDTPVDAVKTAAATESRTETSNDFWRIRQRQIFDEHDYT